MTTVALDIVKAVLTLVFLAFVVWLFVSASFFNVDQAESCREIGMTWVKEYPFGSYGCANVTPVP